MTSHNNNKAALLPLHDALRTGDHDQAKAIFFDLMTQDVSVKISAPFHALNGVEMLWGKLSVTLLEAFPQMEKGDFIFMAGRRWGNSSDEDLVGFEGNFIGLLSKSWLGEYWHYCLLWYGPKGIGAARGHDEIAGIVLSSFCKGLSQDIRNLEGSVFFGHENYVAFAGWPSAQVIHSVNRFLGLVTTGKRVNRPSLDFLRVENGQVRENWVMVSMIGIYRQLGLDVFDRMAQMVNGKDAA